MKKINFSAIATQTLGAAAGAAVVEVGIQKVAPNMKPEMKGVIQLVIGAAASAFGGKSQVIQSMGAGAAAAGGLTLARAFMPDMFGAGPAVQGIGDDDMVYDTDFNITGTDDNAGVQGTDDNSASL